MDCLPGVRVDGFHREMDREERDVLRLGFREAWLYVVLLLVGLVD